MELLSHSRIIENLSAFTDWQLEGNTLVSVKEFKDFLEAVAYINDIASKAEALNHHPDILLFSWNKVKLTVSTHSAGGITALDFELIKELA